MSELEGYFSDLTMHELLAQVDDTTITNHVIVPIALWQAIREKLLAISGRAA